MTMTWQEMKAEFPNEWLLITDYEVDESGQILTGTVERHSRSKDEVYQIPVPDKSIAFEFTGESDFSGLRSHAQHHHV